MWLWQPLPAAGIVAASSTGSLATTLDAATLAGTGAVTTAPRTATLGVTLGACTLAGTAVVPHTAFLRPSATFTAGTSGQDSLIADSTTQFTINIGTPVDGMLIACLFTRNTVEPALSVPLSITWNGVTMGFVTSVTYAAATYRATLAWLVNPAPGSHTLVYTRSGSGAQSYALLWMTVDHARLTQIDVQDQSAIGGATISSPSIGPITPKEANEMVVGISISDQDTPLTMGGWGTEIQQLDFGTYNVSLGRVIQTTPGAVTAAWSSSPGSDWAGVVASFRSDGGAGLLDQVRALRGGVLSYNLQNCVVSATGTVTTPARTATLSTTLGAATLTGTGTVTGAAASTGTLSVTLGTLTLTGAGQLPIVGTAGITLGAATLAGTATLPAHAVLGITLGACTLTGTGTAIGAGVSVTGALLAPSPTLAGTGTIARTVSGALSVPPVTLNATASLQRVLAGVLQVPASTLAASGTRAVFGSGVLLTPASQVTAALNLGRFASGTLGVPAPVLSALAAGQAKTAAGALLLPASVLAGNLLVRRTVSGVLLVPALDLDATGERASTATGVLGVPALSLAAEGAIERFAAGLLLCPALRLDAVAYVGTLQPVRLTPHATATLLNTARAAAVVPREREAVLVGGSARQADPI